MQTKKLGNTGLNVSKICLGTMNWGYQNNELEAHQQLDYALSRGINFIDTAEMYAVPPDPKTCYITETYIGNWIEKRRKRDDFILATKITGTAINNPGVSHVRDGRGVTAAEIPLALDDSLTRLKTDYVDLYQLHWPQRKVPIRGRLNFDEAMIQDRSEVEANIFEVLTELKKHIDAGKIRYIGLSNETPWGVMKFLEIARKHNLPEIQTVQNAYNLIRREYDAGLAEMSVYEGVGLLAYSPLAGGVLSGKYKSGALPEGARYTLWGKDRMKQNFNQNTLAAAEKYENLADKLGITPSQLAISWVNDREFVHSNIIGATTMQQLKEDIDAADIILSPETRKEIDTIFSESPNPATF